MSSIISYLKKKIIYIVILLVVASLAQGYYLRRIGYSQYPEPYLILDEHTNVWHGLSLRKTGIPTAWSILSAYRVDSIEFGSGGAVDGFNIKVEDNLPTLLGYRKVKSPVVSVFEMDMGNGTHHVPLVQPYLDHPPLGAIILSLGVPGEVKTFEGLSNHDMRRAAVYIAILTQFLIVVLAYQLTKSFFVSLAASFAYGTAPSFLLLSRYAQLENVLTPLMLLSLILLIFVNENKIKNSGKTSALLLMSGLLAGMAALIKLSGWVVIVLGLFLLIRWGFAKKKILIFGLPAVFLGLLYFAWGLYLNPGLFGDLLLYQGVSRGFIGSINLLVSAWQVSILHFPFDGWWIGGFVSLLFLPKEERYSPMFASIFLVLFSALFIGGANYPWYFIPLIPFVCISIGIFLKSALESPSFLNIMTMFFVFISSSFYWGYGVQFASKASNSYQQPFTLYRLMFIAFLVFALVWAGMIKLKNFKKFWYILMFAVFLGLIYLNQRGFYYILGNWGKLPSLYTPGTF